MSEILTLSFFSDDFSLIKTTNFIPSGKRVRAVGSPQLDTYPNHRVIGMRKK
jgi:hypothetical protein